MFGEPYPDADFTVIHDGFDNIHFLNRRTTAHRDGFVTLMKLVNPNRAQFLLTLGILCANFPVRITNEIG